MTIPTLRAASPAALAEFPLSSFHVMRADGKTHVCLDCMHSEGFTYDADGQITDHMARMYLRHRNGILVSVEEARADPELRPHLSGYPGARDARFVRSRGLLALADMRGYKHEHSNPMEDHDENHWSVVGGIQDYDDPLAWYEEQVLGDPDIVFVTTK